MSSTLRQPLVIPAARHEKLYLLAVSAEHEVSEQEITRVQGFAWILTVTFQL